jgi:hypothetical protein
MTEARRIARAIRPYLNEYADRYDQEKYRPNVYRSVRRAFRCGHDVQALAIRDALLWKWGHLGKPAIPAAHTALIEDVQNGWSKTVAGLPASTPDAFHVLDARFGPGRFITIAFLLHLLRPADVPIVDQHNFRSVNWFMREVRPGWKTKAVPTRYRDLEVTAAFMKAVLKGWRQSMPASAPAARQLDKFLMMYGKAIKVAKRPVIYRAAP